MGEEKKKGLFEIFHSKSQPGEGYSGLFRRLRRSEAEPGEAAERTAPAPSEIQPDAAPAPEPEEPSRACVHLPPSSATWQLWQLWRESGHGGIADPALYLDDMPPGHFMPLNEGELHLEIHRLGAFLEKKASERMQQLHVQTQSEPHLPAECLIHISQNGMLAWAFAFPPVGDTPDLSMGSLAAAMQDAKITSGADPLAINAFIHERKYFRLSPIAWGTPPVEGEDGRVVEYYPRERVHKIVMDEKGNVDYRAQSYVQNIRKGDVICDIIPPLPGIDGIQITGKAVKARPVKPARIPSGTNTSLSADGTHLIASMDGHIEFNGTNFQVRPILYINGDVDYSSGNIDFRGDVHITGEVRQGFSVRATGTVTIDGLVEAATVEADGDIVITKGVLGDNRALIRSRGSVRAKYLESCVVYTGDCTFADCIVNCQIYSDNNIRVLTGRGTIIGGCLTAARQVEASVIGSKAGRKTEIILGILPYIQEEQKNNEIDLLVIKKELGEVETRLHYLEDSQDLFDDGKELAKLRLRKSVLALKADKLTKRQQELSESTTDLNLCRLSCGTVYPLTQLTIGPATRTIENVWIDCSAIYDTDLKELRIS